MIPMRADGGARALESAAESSAPGTPHPANDPRHIELILGQMESLPTLPAIATRLLRIASADDADVKEIIRLIESDPPTAAKVLAMCSRAGRATRTEITTVGHAVVMVGIEALKSAVLSVHVVEFARRALKQDDPARVDDKKVFDQKGFWRHSIAVACAAEGLARAHPRLGVRPDEAFVAGLLHDVGKIALHVVLPRAYDQTLDASARTGEDLRSCELRMLGVDHHQAGKRLLQRWGLPRSLQAVVESHGDARAISEMPTGPWRTLMSMITAADRLSRRLLLGWSGNGAEAPDLGATIAAAELDADRVLPRMNGSPEGDRAGRGAGGTVLEQLPQAVAARCRDLGVDDRDSDGLLMDALQGANARLGRISGVLVKRTASLKIREAILTEIQTVLTTPAVEPRDVAVLIAASAARIAGVGAGVLWREDSRMWRLFAAPVGGQPPGQRRIDGSWTNIDEAARAILNESRSQFDLVRLCESGEMQMAMLVAKGGRQGQALPRHCDALVEAWRSLCTRAAAMRQTRTLEDLRSDLAEASGALARAAPLIAAGRAAGAAARHIRSSISDLEVRLQGAEGAAIGRASHLAHLLGILASPTPLNRQPVALPEMLGRLIRDIREDRTGDPAQTDQTAPVVNVRVTIAQPLHAVALDRALFGVAMREILESVLARGRRGGVEILVQTGDEDGRLMMSVSEPGEPFGLASDVPAESLGLSVAAEIIGRHGGELRFGEHGAARIELTGWRWRASEAGSQRQADERAHEPSPEA